MAKIISTIFILSTIISLLLVPMHLAAQDGCRAALKKCEEIMSAQEEEIKILDESLSDEIEKNKELETELNHAKIWLWIIPPVGLLYTIFE